MPSRLALASAILAASLILAVSSYYLLGAGAREPGLEEPVGVGVGTPASQPRGHTGSPAATKPRAAGGWVGWPQAPPRHSKIKLCADLAKLSITGSTHPYEPTGPQDFKVYARQGDLVRVEFRVEPRSEALECVRWALELPPEARLRLEYSLGLGPTGGLDPSRVELEGGGRSYVLEVDLAGVEPGVYHIILYMRAHVTGEAEVRENVEYGVVVVVK